MHVNETLGSNFMYGVAGLGKCTVGTLQLSACSREIYTSVAKGTAGTQDLLANGIPTT